ncbi:hypothetical protein KP001_18365 [Geomonas subterranea]|uniref:Uncharacterized protein n=1 Tax=Geomonas subterranea TaxID=2847989 RepID=A0ABX8LFV5_9BACT|nr:hypothetical protein [Geomonas subterranea]QXE90349.1 hypothetical protein KP001_18365 [Geomonas subterranea]QXM07525.1 hypothetical protein KP002_10925 [Geomonas subterranea]
MLIDRLQPESVSVSSSSPQLTSLSSSVQNPQPEKQKAEDPAITDQVLFSGQGDRRLAGIRLQNERQNSAAAAIRETDKAAQDLGQKIDKLKEPLETIVKNFPPFAPQDKERVRLLRSYTALRKEIDQLTLPPPPSIVEARKQVALPEPLGMNADDSQIADHVDKLDAAAQSLTALRGDIAAGTTSFVADGRFASIFSAPKGPETQVSEPIASESRAAEKSAEIGQQFAESVTQGVAQQHPQFLKGLS